MSPKRFFGPESSLIRLLNLLDSQFTSIQFLDDELLETGRPDAVSGQADGDCEAEWLEEWDCLRSCCPPGSGQHNIVANRFSELVAGGQMQRFLRYQPKS